MEERRAERPRGHPYDEIRLVRVPYFKKSGSGSEWRTDFQIQVCSKNELVCQLTSDQEETALLANAVDLILGKSLHVLSMQRANLITKSDLCDQEGCKEKSLHTLKLKRKYTEVDEKVIIFDPYESDATPLVRKFCSMHAIRGEGYMEDQYDNYDLL